MNFFSKKNKNFSTNQRGVSLIEIMLVVAIIVILAAITIPIQNSVLTRQYLSDGSSNLQSAFRTANLQAKLGSYGLDAGIWIGEPVSGIPNIVMYRGPSYEARNKELDTPIDMPGGLTIAATPDNDVHFSILTAASDHETIINIKNSAGEKTLVVNVLGTVIEQDEPQPAAK